MRCINTVLFPHDFKSIHIHKFTEYILKNGNDEACQVQLILSPPHTHTQTHNIFLFLFDNIPSFNQGRGHPAQDHICQLPLSLDVAISWFRLVECEL